MSSENVFYEPKVYLIARPWLNWDAVDEFLRDDAGDADWHQEGEAPRDGESLCEFMGRMCYGSFGDRQGRRDPREYLQNIMKQGHGSVLEHANWSFLVTRCTRGYTHQQVRHRAGWAYSQESTHFVKYDSDAARICLPGLKSAPEHALKLAESSARLSVGSYMQLHQTLEESFPDCERRRKALTGQARSLLPQALESKIGFTANARALRHFCQLRGEEYNTVEIRQVAHQVLLIMRREAPILFYDFEAHTSSDGYPYLTCLHAKV